MAVSGSRIGVDTDESSSGEPGVLDPPPVGGADDPPGAGVEGGDVGVVVVVRGGRMMKQAGPALRWLACAAVGLRVVLA